MSFSELVVSEKEWQDLLSVKGYLKLAFDVDIKRKDESDAADRVPRQSYSAHPSSQIVSNRFEASCGRDVGLEGAEHSEKSVGSEGVILRPLSVIVLLETSISHTSSAVETLDKCRKFMCAFTPSNPDYRSIPVKVEDQHTLDMVRESAAIIQQSTSALVSIHPDQLTIRIKGHQSSVELARQKIDMIIRDPNSKSLLFENDGQSLRAGSSNYSPSVWDVLQETNKVNKNSKTDLISSTHILKDRNHELSTQTTDSISPLQQQYSRVPCESSFDFSSDEDILLSDDRFKDRVAQASKCGFSDRQISNVLRKLDINCSMDDMMKELIKEPQEDDDPVLSLTDPKSIGDAVLLSSEEEDLSSEEAIEDDSSNLRDIIIDGSNVAMSHGQKVFSCKGIKIAVDWFKNRGHKNITVFVPQWRKEASRPDAPISDQEILTELEEERIVVFTPSRRVGGTRIVCYDDRYVLNLAVQTNGIIVSNDVYRDLVRERDDFKEVVEKRLLMYTFVKDSFMPPEDPYGRQGPSLDNFLRIKPAEPKHRPPNCPYGKKCTYGMKCKYYHPERRYAPQKMVAEKLKESAELRLKSSKSFGDAVEKGKGHKPRLSRTVSLNQNETLKSPPIVESSPAETKKPPPLMHSISLVCQNSYLTESMLKMEQAEIEEKKENTSSLAGNFVANTDKIKDNLTNSGNCMVTSCTSYSPVSFPPLSTRTDFPTCFEPAGFSATASNTESQTRNISDHLLVAKNLSDEDSSGQNFFAKHTSRNSASSLQDRSAFCNVDQPSPPNSIRSPQPQSSLQPLDPESLDSQVIYLPPKIPSQSSFSPKSSSKKTTTEESSFSSNYSPVSPTPCLSADYSSGPVFSHSAKSYQVPQPQLLKRSISSTAPSRSPDHLVHRNTDRKFSLNATGIQSSADSYVQTGAFASMPPPPLPVGHHQPPAHHLYQHDIRGKKESVDSAIGSSELSGEQSFFLYRSPTDDIPSPFYSTSNAASPTTFFPPHQPMRQQQQVYMSSPHGFGPQSNAITSQTTHSAYPASPAYAGFPTPSSPWQYQHLSSSASSSPSRLPMGNFPHPGNPAPPMQMQQGHHPHHLNSPPFGIYNSAPPQLQTTTAQHPSFYPPNPSTSFYPPMTAYGTYTDRSDSMYEPGTPVSPYSQGPPPPSRSRAKEIDEEAPISVDDPRYYHYYNLSSVYGERVVRTFMNRNPDISRSNIKMLHTMISAYKQEHGM